MTAASLLRDLTAFSVQIAIVAMGIAVLLKLVRIPAGARYLGLRLALVASLLAPWLLRTPEVQAPVLATDAAQTISIAAVPAASAPSAAAPRAAAVTPARSPVIPWMQVGFGALLIGIAARVVWLGMGVLRLLRLKRAGVVVDAPEYSELQQQLGTHATISQVAGLPQPATFGVRRPIVLLPDALVAASASLRRAVVAHELFHVRRRDWLSVLAEEMVRTVLWFHPAIHWMTAQIQLAREEIVDELTVRAIGDRRTYVEALLAFADTPGLSPAPAFAHRRQLFQRILSVSKERVMSRPRVVTSAAVLIAGVFGASWYASTLFPIVKAAKIDAQAAQAAAAQASTPSGSRIVLGGNVELRGGELRASSVELALGQQTGSTVAVRPVTPENPIPRRTLGVAPVTPPQYASAQVAVSARVTVDRNGAVTSVDPDSCSASGRNADAAMCAAFNGVAAAAIRQWRYDRPAQAPIQFYVRVAFRSGVEAAIAQSGESYLRGPQDSLSLETDRDNATLQRAVAALQADLARMTDMSRELERAQRLAIERGTPDPDMVRLQRETARAQAEMARVEEQLRSNRSNQTIDERLRDGEQLRAAMEQLRRVQETHARQTAEEQARAEEQTRAAIERLRENERRAAEAALAARAREFERQIGSATTAVVSPTPTTPFDGSPQLKSPSGRAPIRVTPPMTPPTPIKRVQPQYMAVAMQARVEGTVTVEVLVDEKGHVADARVLKSIPLLDKSAIDAAKQWEFTPTLMNGEAVPVLLMLEMNFTLK